jgi:nicotinamide mononucleotide transporter
VTHELLRALAASGILESAAVLLGVIYVLLILKRNRFGWIAGGVSSAIYVYLAASARLPMQSTLQAYYVVMAGYGWLSWKPALKQQQGGGIVVWPWAYHLRGWCAILVLSVVSAQWLAHETHAAWPYLDSLTTWISLLATWMTARMVLENWLYWIAADAVTAFLFAAQGYFKSTALFTAYLVIAVFGFREWLLKYRQRSR